MTGIDINRLRSLMKERTTQPTNSPKEPTNHATQQPAIQPSTHTEPKKLSIAERLAILRQTQKTEIQKVAISTSTSETVTYAESISTVSTISESVNTLQEILNSSYDRYGNLLSFNAEQTEAITRISNGEDIVLIGSAGTGKTTTTQAAVSALIQGGQAGVLDSGDHKHLVSGTPGIIITSFTRRAVSNIRRNVPANLTNNCVTVHKLLEYEPVRGQLEFTDPETGEEKTKNTLEFLPKRNADFPLPATINTIIIEESGTISTELFAELKAALTHKCQIIFLGDIQQLPPVFGSAILGFKMLELPVVELKTVYRQALESPIIRLAQRVLSGKPIPATEYKDWAFPGQLTIHPWKKKLLPEDACIVFGRFITAAETNGLYDPDNDIILCPYGKAFGTIEINKHIAQHLALKHSRFVHQIIAGFNYHYFSIGDKVVIDKNDGIITDIQENPKYLGKPFLKPTLTLDYWGCEQGSAGPAAETDDYSTLSDEDIEFLLSSASTEERVNQASHIISVYFPDIEQTRTFSEASDINNCSLGYAITIHKSIGSEWRKVFVVIHQQHHKMMQREMAYTAFTRAREELYIICEPETMTTSINSQRIKGNSLKEKAEFFKGKIDKLSETEKEALN